MFIYFFCQFIFFLIKFCIIFSNVCNVSLIFLSCKFYIASIYSSFFRCFNSTSYNKIFFSCIRIHHFYGRFISLYFNISISLFCTIFSIVCIAIMFTFTIFNTYSCMSITITFIMTLSSEHNSFTFIIWIVRNRFYMSTPCGF